MRTRHLLSPLLAVRCVGSSDHATPIALKTALKTGDTGHSNFLVIDETFAWVSRYDPRPRSHAIAGEMAIAVADERIAASLGAVFERDYAEATAVHPTDDLQTRHGLLGKVATREFFDLL